MIAVLTGGTGGAKLIEGLVAEIDPAELAIICNTGDDCEFYGLNISPDIDTITYTLGGLSDSTKGWGIRGDTFAVLEQLKRLGNDGWFNLGDKDLATHITRTDLLRQGHALSAVTARIAHALGIRATILPMSDQRVETRVTTPLGEISFQEFFVKQRWSLDVSAIRYAGVEQSRPAAGVLETIHNARAIVICPSNPITSIGPILAVPGIRNALRSTGTPIIGVSPLIGSTAVSGPAHKLLQAVGLEPSTLGVAVCYRDFLKLLFIADDDQHLSRQIEALGVGVRTTDIRMPSVPDKRRLALEILSLIR